MEICENRIRGLVLPVSGAGKFLANSIAAFGGNSLALDRIETKKHV
jgi:hypothetical protein